MGCETNAAKKTFCVRDWFRGCLSRRKRNNSEQGLFIVVTSDVMGKDPDIGRVLMKGFFETMKSMGEFPRTIFFMNAGVKLTTTDEEFVSTLKSIEDAGVEIFSCGTCLKHYGIEDGLRVGHRGSTGQVIEGMNDMRTVWI